MSALPFITGCGDNSNGLKFYSVEGRVLCGDLPVAGAHVVFHPDSSTAPPELPNYPGGRTDAEGRFKLTTLKTNDGAPAGTYKVLVIWPAKPGRSDGSGEGEEGDQLAGRYATPDVTPLTVEIKQGSNDPFTFVVQQ